MIGSKVTWWDRLLSHFKEVHLTTVEGSPNPTLQVSLVQNRFQLSTENAIYSFDDLYLNFGLAFKQLKLPPNDSKFLLLGLGLGSVPFILEREHDAHYHTTAVEVDEAVIMLAARFTFPRLTQRIEVIHADAEIFVKTNEGQYDLIVVDLFLDDIVPPYFETQVGMLRLKKLLSSEGLLLINRLYRNGSDKKRTTAFYENIFCKVFSNARFLDVGGNWILVAGNGVSDSVLR
ncbi:MAG: hypothetical protein HKN76_07345 [Saprospiraceae bacterium]|nr:hypothetical protein [Saprospiraceae bacterium]